MADFTGEKPASTYKDIIQVPNTNNGTPAALTQTQSGNGVATAITVSQTQMGTTTRMNYPEIATPANPSAYNLSVYAKDVAGTTRFATLDSTGNEQIIDLSTKIDKGGVARIVNTGETYADIPTAIAALSDFDTLHVFSQDNAAAILDFTTLNLSSITVVGDGSASTPNTRVGRVLLDNTCTDFDFQNMDISASSADSLLDTGSEGTAFNECRFDRVTGSVSVRISGAATRAPRFSNCFIKKDVSLNGTNFAGFCEFVGCTIEDILGSNNMGMLVRRSEITTSIQQNGDGLLDINDSQCSFVGSTQSTLGIPSFILNNVTLRNFGTGLPSFVTKTGTAQFRILNSDFDIDASTLSGTDVSDAYPISFSYNIIGKTAAALGSLARIAGQLHYATDTTRALIDDGTALQTLAYSSDLGNLAALDTVGTTDIDDDAVTFAKIQEFAANTILINNTGSASNPIAGTVSQTRILLGLATTDTPTFDEVSVSTTTPSGPSILTSRSWVEALFDGIDPKASCEVATVDSLNNNTSISGTATYNNTGGTSARGQITATLAVSDTFTVDGVTFSSADNGTARSLLKDELGELGEDSHGIYVFTIAGTSLTLDRTTDFDSDADVTQGTRTWVVKGTNKGTLWFVITDDPIIVGGASGSNIVFDSPASAAGTDLNWVSSTRTMESSSGGNAVINEVVAGGNSGLQTGADKTKSDFITVTQAVDLDTMESDIATNNAKVTNANHTGDVTGATVLTIAGNVVTNAKAAQMAQSTIKGRIEGSGTGNPDDLSPLQAKDILGLALADDVIFGSVKARIPIVTETGTAKTLALSDANTKQIGNNAATQTFTLPTNASVGYPIGTTVDHIQEGAGQVVVKGDTGVIHNGVSGGSVSILSQYQALSSTKVGTDTWITAGNY